MYLDFHGLREAPFSITPDPRFVFLSERHRDALAHLLYGIGQGGGGGFVQLTGEVGTGKTTLSRLLLAQLPAHVRVALVLNPQQEPVQLLESVCEELRVDVEGRRGNAKALVDALNVHLLDAHAQGLRVVLIVDEAQNLTPHEVKTIISRAGPDTKIVFTGDIYQIDTPYLDEESNGLSYLIDKAQNHPLYAHITLHKGERSPLASLATDLL